MIKLEPNIGTLLTLKRSPNGSKNRPIRSHCPTATAWHILKEKNWSPSFCSVTRLGNLVPF